MILDKEYLEKWNNFIKNIKSDDFNNSFVLEYNPHSTYFEHIEESIRCIDFPSEETKQKCIKENHVWLIEYWATSVSHINLGDYDLENLLKRFLDSIEIQKDGKIWYKK